MGPPPSFSERLVERRRLWWDPPWPGRGRGLRDAIHRLSERRSFRSRTDPDQAWRCCDRWQRTLLNKWNAREFAARHGCELPKLYWHGAGPSQAALDSLPDDFVIRPVFGFDDRGVAVITGGRERLKRASVSRDELGAWLPRTRLTGAATILIEEYARPHHPSLYLPLELKLHTFAGEVVVAQMIERPALWQARQRPYTPGWQPIPDRLQTYWEDLEPSRADELMPGGSELDSVLAMARRLGSALGTYMRIDFLVSERGPLFGEFSSVPLLGGYNTLYADRLLGEAWTRICPNAG